MQPKILHPKINVVCYYTVLKRVAAPITESSHVILLFHYIYFFRYIILIWRNGIRRNGIRRNGIWRNGIRRNGIRRNMIRRNGIRRNGIRQNGIQRNGIQHNGFRRNGIRRNGIRRKFSFMVHFKSSSSSHIVNFTSSFSSPIWLITHEPLFSYIDRRKFSFMVYFKSSSSSHTIDFTSFHHLFYGSHMNHCFLAMIILNIEYDI